MTTAREGQPPLRNSVAMCETDADWEVASATEILLNGAVVSQVISYDCEAGTVERYVTDESGRLVLDSAREEALRETLTGTVTARWRDAS